MAFKFITLFCATLAFANAGLLQQQPLIASSPLLATRSLSAVPISAPLTRIAYSPANEVSQVYSSIAAPAALSIATPAIGSSQQSTIRSLAGTVSTYSKAVDTAFSSVRKADTRISNNVFAPAYAQAYAPAAIATRSLTFAPTAIAAPTYASAAFAPAAIATRTLSLSPAIAPAAFSAPALAPAAYATRTLSLSPSLAPAAYAAPAYASAAFAPAALGARSFSLGVPAAPIAKTFISAAPAAYAAQPAAYLAQPAAYAPALAASPAGLVSRVSFDGIGARYAW